ncbi:hypothetical protein FBU31_007040, partial [Coemansia sp. 'formosensis']
CWHASAQQRRRGGGIGWGEACGGYGVGGCRRGHQRGGLVGWGKAGARRGGQAQALGRRKARPCPCAQYQQQQQQPADERHQCVAVARQGPWQGAAGAVHHGYSAQRRTAHAGQQLQHCVGRAQRRQPPSPATQAARASAGPRCRGTAPVRAATRVVCQPRGRHAPGLRQHRQHACHHRRCGAEARCEVTDPPRQISISKINSCRQIIVNGCHARGCTHQRRRHRKPQAAAAAHEPLAHRKRATVQIRVARAAEPPRHLCRKQQPPRAPGPASHRQQQQQQRRQQQQRHPRACACAAKDGPWRCSDPSGGQGQGALCRQCVRERRQQIIIRLGPWHSDVHAVDSVAVQLEGPGRRAPCCCCCCYAHSLGIGNQHEEDCVALRRHQPPKPIPATARAWRQWAAGDADVPGHGCASAQVIHTRAQHRQDPESAPDQRRRGRPPVGRVVVPLV